MTVETNLTELTAIIVACFVSNNSVPPTEVAALISSTYAALLRIDDGRRLRALKRYLERKYSLSPEQYRMKWGLPEDYPMVAPAYSDLRRKIAKENAGRLSEHSHLRKAAAP
jgi:predicted transcriptional regulator